jgi:hypothetical protein
VMMTRIMILDFVMGFGLVSLLAVVIDLPSANAQAPQPRTPLVVVADTYQAFFKAYCLSCHNESTTSGKVRLDNIPAEIADIPTAERWQKVLNAINSGEMPPSDKPQPAPKEKADFLASLSQAMVDARRKLADSGGVITMRRLNKREYENTLYELLGIKLAAKGLPNDGGARFDTIGKSLFFSSDQFEHYLTHARKALDLAIATGPRPETKRQRIEAEEEANHRITFILRGYQMGGYRANKEWQASGGKKPSDFGIVDEAEMKFRMTVWERNTAPMIDYLTRPETKTGALLTIHEPNGQVGIAIPDEMPAGKYRIRAAMGVGPSVDVSRAWVEIGIRGKALNDPMNLLACRQVTAPWTKPEIVEFELDVAPLTVPLSVDIGPETKKRIPIGERVIAFRERQHNNSQASSFRHSQTLTKTGFGIDPVLWIDWAEWEGPILPQWPSTAHQQIFFKGSDASKDDAYAREVIAKFAELAFRGRPVKPSYLDKLVAHYQEKRAAGESFEQALKEPLSIVLASPSFLYVVEPSQQSPGKRPLDGIELANRLAFFLWSAPPDDELLALGRNGKLKDSTVLAAQVERLLASSKSWEFVMGFTHQWLGMDRLDFFQFNFRLFPEFDDSAKRAARDEVYHTLYTVLTENLPVRTLLKADFVVVNDLLAQYYDIANVRGPQFRKVPVPTGLPRGGLPSMAAVLAMGSDGERSSPVERGAWVMRKLLHNPPPPAPANVPQLSRNAGKLLSARELLAAHMEQPQCYQCHRKIDPIGFGLENFDAAGKWRENELVEIAGGNIVRKSMEHPIDAYGTLPDGTEFNGFFELRDALAAKEDTFARGLTENLISYALGRPYGFSDDLLTTDILTHAKADQLTFNAIIQALVASPAFQAK